MQLEELNMENSRLVNPELERLQGVVDSLKAEVSRITHVHISTIRNKCNIKM